jgi:hypothetical protein
VSSLITAITGGKVWCGVTGDDVRLQLFLCQQVAENKEKIIYFKSETN